MTGTRFLCPIFTAVDSNGDPIPSARLYFYDNGTSNPKQIYADIDLTNPVGQPVEADGAGRFLVDMYLQNSTYSVKHTDASGSTIWVKDNVNASASVTSTGAFPFPGAVVEFYGTQPQLNVALSLFWYVMDGTSATPNLNDKFVKTCIDVADIGNTGGANSTIPTGTVQGHVLSIAEMPSHSHGIGGTATQDGVGDIEVGQNNAVQSGLTGGGQAHAHGLVMDTLDNQPAFYSLIRLLYKGS